VSSIVFLKRVYKEQQCIPFYRQKVRLSKIEAFVALTVNICCMARRDETESFFF
jgi:hypothetical protein